MFELSTRQRILLEAQDLVQRRGFFGLSLQELADRIPIRKPSLYAHFESKENLGVALVQEYQKQFKEFEVAQIGCEPKVQIDHFLLRYQDYLNLGKVCPHSAFGLDGPNLPESIRAAYLELRSMELSWLVGVITEGQKKGVFLNPKNPLTLAQALLQKMVGVQMMVRLTGQSQALTEASAEILQEWIGLH
jgi:TetR/AcrR family transcriptional repressor of nem operon